MRKIVLLVLIFMLLFPAAAFGSYQYELEQGINNMRMNLDNQKRQLSECKTDVERYISEVKKARNDNLSNLKTAQDDFDRDMFTFFGNEWFPTWLNVLKKYKETGLSVGTPEGQTEAAKFSAMTDPQTGVKMSMTYGAYDSAKYMKALNGIFYARRYIDYYNNLIDYAVSNKKSGITQQQHDKNMGYYRNRSNSAIVGDPYPFNKERVKVSDPGEAAIYDLLLYINEEGGGFSSEDVAGSSSGDLFAGKWQGKMTMKNIYVDRINRQFGVDLSREEAQQAIGKSDTIGAKITKTGSGKYKAIMQDGPYTFEGKASVSGNKIQVYYHDQDLPQGVDYVYTGQTNAGGTKVSGSCKLTSPGGPLAIGNWHVNRIGETSGDTGNQQPDDDTSEKPEDVPENTGGDPAGSGASGNLGNGSNITPSGDGQPEKNNSKPDTDKTKDQEKDTSTPDNGEIKDKDLSPGDKERKKAGMTIFDGEDNPGEKNINKEKKKAAVEINKKRLVKIAEKASMEFIENTLPNMNTGIKTAHLVRKDSEIKADKEKEPGSYFEEKYTLNEKILNPVVDKIIENIPGLKYFSDQVKDKKDDIIFSDKEEEKKKEKDLEKKIIKTKKEFNVDEDSAEGYSKWCAFDDREKKLKPAQNMVTDFLSKAQKTAVAPFKWTLDKMGSFMKKNYANAAGKDIKHVKKLIKKNIDNGKSPEEAVKTARNTYTHFNIDNAESIYGRSQATLAWNSKGKYKDRGSRFDSIVETMKKDGEL
ncbi:MAG: hypothetical protein K9L17_09315 [Clostridiales bacterium]|nr:hypothetical protein [Clostridiales bacterium]MCF8022877.1 hypothetical protein [Clostridiales bacterium]